MREPKFRAWLPHARKTVWSDYGTVEQRQPDGRRRGRMVEFDPLFFSISHDSLEHPQLFTDTPEHFYGEDIGEAARDAALLQYTGLKDKNGVEIYEGDIVRWRTEGVNLDGDERTSSVTSEVRFDVTEARFGLDKGEDDGSVWVIYGDAPEDYEVIGNVYENPELLTKQ